MPRGDRHLSMSQWGFGLDGSIDLHPILRCTLIDHGVLPIDNENDAISHRAIQLGDNDTLGALVTNLVEADVLVILTDQRGLYTADPRKNPEAEFVATARAGDPALEKMAGGAARASAAPTAAPWCLCDDRWRAAAPHRIVEGLVTLCSERFAK